MKEDLVLLIITIFIAVVLAITASGWVAWQATPGQRSQKALAAGLTGAALVLLAIIFVAEVLLLVISSTLLITAIAVATGRMSVRQGLAAGVGAPLVLYMGIILIRIMHGLAFGGSSVDAPSSLQIESIDALQIFGVDLGLLAALLGVAMLAAVAFASADARPWLVFIGAALLLGGGAMELHQHWDSISPHLDFADPRSSMWALIGTFALALVVVSLANHSRGRGS